MKRVTILFNRKVFYSKSVDLTEEQLNNNKLLQTLLRCEKEDFNCNDFDSDELDENPAHILNEIIDYRNDVYDMGEDFECFNIEIKDI